MPSAIIRGSWGDVTVDRKTGAILKYDDNGHTTPEERGYHDILYFLPETLVPGRDGCLDAHGETDILCVGYVTETGIVVEPMASVPDPACDDELIFEDLLRLPAPMMASC